MIAAGKAGREASLTQARPAIPKSLRWAEGFLNSENDETFLNTKCYW
jgi:hypothetical protein